MKTDRELLEEIKENNRREKLSCEINIKVGERSKVKYPNKLDVIQNFITTQKGRLEDLEAGIEAIDDTLNEMPTK